MDGSTNLRALLRSKRSEVREAGCAAGFSVSRAHAAEMIADRKGRKQPTARGRVLLLCFGSVGGGRVRQ